MVTINHGMVNVDNLNRVESVEEHVTKIRDISLGQQFLVTKTNATRFDIYGVNMKMKRVAELGGGIPIARYQREQKIRSHTIEFDQWEASIGITRHAAKMAEKYGIDVGMLSFQVNSGIEAGMRNIENNLLWTVATGCQTGATKTVDGQASHTHKVGVNVANRVVKDDLEYFKRHLKEHWTIPAVVLAGPKAFSRFVMMAFDAGFANLGTQAYYDAKMGDAIPLGGGIMCYEHQDMPDDYALMTGPGIVPGPVMYNDLDPLFPYYPGGREAGLIEAQIYHDYGMILTGLERCLMIDTAHAVASYTDLVATDFPWLDM